MGKGLEKGPETFLKISKMFQALFQGPFPPHPCQKSKKDSARNHEKSRNSCQANKNQVEGIIDSASHFDLSLPASGILIWKVNEWLIH